MEIRRCMKCMHALAAGETFCSECGRPYGSVETEPFALKPGTILDGKYLVGEMLGQGGFGITYIGFDLLLEQKVAIKEYYPMSTGMVSRENSTTVVWSSAVMQKSGMEKGFDSFLKEARKMAKLGGIPGVVGVKSVFIQNETAYIVMDFIEGETLLKKLQREGPMDYGTCISLMTPIMQALAEVHKHGIIHRDISPDNIMVQSDGKLILLDLGAAKDLDIQGKDGNVQSSQMVAKHGFSPVEQYGQAGKIGPWTDVYAMAATIYYCCTGVLPPSATDRMIEDTLTCRPRLTKEQFDVLAFCMNVLPQNRPQNMDALLQIVTHPAGKTPPVRDVPKTEPVRPETRNLQPLKPDPGRPLPKWLIPGIAAAVAVIALIISVGSGGKKSTPASSVKAPAAQAVTTEPVPTVPMEVHTMAVADYAFDEDAFFWGQERYMRKDVKTLTFQSSLQNVPSSAWDVSEAGDGSVLAWMDNGNLYVAADGAIAPNSNASCLLQDFANLKTIDFGNCFDTSNVTDMHSMFAGCSSLTSLDLSGFDTSNVTYMSYMFQMCDNLSNVDLSSFSTSNVTNMRSTFESCGSLIRLDLTSFDTSKVTDMNSMFYECGSLTQLNLTSFDTSKVTDMAFMFTSCNSLTSLDLSNFDTSNVTNMLWMFGLCYDLTSLNLSNFDTSAVTEMDDILTGCDVLTDLNCSDARILKEYSNRR
ncbi:MAG: BspA family leucine-rich repeat surface protein [Oscillospiraceae bacterium]